MPPAPPAARTAARKSPARKSASTRLPRADNRLPQVLDAAAALFARKGYQAASVREIVKAVGMLPGSLYYHFANKDELLVAVYAEGVRRISEAVSAAVGGARDPWDQLEAACVAHLESLLDQSAYAKVVVSVHPADAPPVAKALVALRDGYEAQFIALMERLPLPQRLANRKTRSTLRRLLLGALNWAPVWYRPNLGAAAMSPQRIAQDFVQLLKTELSSRNPT